MAEHLTGVLHPESRPEAFSAVVANQRSDEMVLCWMFLAGLVVSSLIFGLVAGPVVLEVYAPSALDLPDRSLTTLEGWISPVGFVVGGFATAVLGSYQCVRHLTRALIAVHNQDRGFAEDLYRSAPCSKKAGLADKVGSNPLVRALAGG